MASLGSARPYSRNSAGKRLQETGTSPFPQSKHKTKFVSSALPITCVFQIIRSSRITRRPAACPAIDLLIPNIEFRLAPPTDKATAVNIHLLMSPDDPQHESRILEALARLSWTYNKLKYSCAPDQLRRSRTGVRPEPS